MDVLVSGSTGLIGSALVPALERAGHRVRRLVRPDSSEVDGGVPWEPARGVLDPAALEGVDAVVNLAGAGLGDKRWNEERKRVLVESRTLSTGLLARTLATLDPTPAVMVSASAVGIYGDRGDDVVTEGSEPGDDFLADLCRRWEDAASPAAAAGIRVVHTRSGVVLSARGGLLGRLLLPFKLGLGGRLGSGRQYMSWITIDDEVAAVLHLLERSDVAGPVNLTTPNPVTNREFVEALGRVLGRPTLIPTPLFPLKLVYGPELVETLSLAGQRVLPTRLEASGFRFAEPEIEGALRAVLGKPAG